MTIADCSKCLHFCENAHHSSCCRSYKFELKRWSGDTDRQVWYMISYRLHSHDISSSRKTSCPVSQEWEHQHFSASPWRDCLCVSVYVRDSYVTVRDILSIFFMLFRYTVPLDAFSNKNKFESLQVCLKRPPQHCEAQLSIIIKAVYVVKAWYLNYENRTARADCFIWDWDSIIR